MSFWAYGAENLSQSQLQLQAEYLLRLADFVEWPADAFPKAQAPFVVGVMGQSRIGSEMRNLKIKQLKGRELVVREFKGALEFRGEETPGRREESVAARRAKKIGELRSCHILFISSSEGGLLSLILKPLEGSTVLTVGESSGFSEKGGIINFVGMHPDVEFEINREAARQARLAISSKLLNLAREAQPVKARRKN